MRPFLATLLLCLPLSACPVIPAVQAQTMKDDRYFVAWGGMAEDVTKAVREKRKRHRHERPAKAKKAVAVIRTQKVSFPKPRPPGDDPDQLEAYRVIANLIADGKVTIRRVEIVRPITLAEGFVREFKRAFGQPARYIRAPLSCARNVNAALAERGIKGTGSALAKSFLRWGKPSPPVPGAVAIYNRGRNPKSGHVAIVAHVKRGIVYVWNPSPRKGWKLIAYRKRAIAYRVAA